MVTDNNYENSICQNWYVDTKGSPVAKYITDIKQVSTTDNLVQLTNVPYIIDKMQIKASDGVSSTDLYRVYNMDEVVKNANAYYLSATGMMSFNPAQAGKTFTFYYYGAGVELISVDRIFYKNSENVIEVLGYLITKGYEGLKYLADIGDAKTVINRIETDVTNGNNTATRIETAITNGDLNTMNTKIQKNTDDIKNMQIGVRNLLLNGTGNLKTSYWQTGIVSEVKYNFQSFKVSNSSTTQELNYASNRISLKPNTTYTVSFYVTGDSNLVSSDIFVLCRKVNSTQAFDYIYSRTNMIPSTSGFDYITWQFTTASDVLDGYVRLDNNGTKTTGIASNVWFSRINLVEGNKATIDCLPAPEDTQLQINSLDGRLSTVENLTTNTAMVNTVTTSTTYKNDLASKADKIYVEKLVPISKGKCKFIAHRGLNACSPENTLPAYINAGQFGFYGGETDITTTSDGYWVVMHDDNVDRMTNGTGNVSSLTLSQIKALNIDSGNNVNAYPSLKIPTFEEYLITCKKSGLVPIIELKESCDITKIQNLVSILKTYNMEYRSIIISFGLNLLQEVRRYSSVKLQYLVNTITADAINSVVALGNAGIDSSYSTVVQQNIIDCHNQGVEVNAWTVDDFDACLQLVNWGIDYITSNKIGGME